MPNPSPCLTPRIYYIMFIIQPTLWGRLLLPKHMRAKTSFSFLSEARKDVESFLSRVPLLFLGHPQLIFI